MKTDTALDNPLTEIIQKEIAPNGYISFARFMQLALYSPEWGYYTSSNPLGKPGDFVTAPEISPLFAQCVARQVIQIEQTLNEGMFLEIGAGSGLFAKDLLLTLEKLDYLPRHYFIFDISPALKQSQKQLLLDHIPHLLDRVTWLDELPPEFKGIIFANEVMDALPFHCFKVEKEGIKEKCVTWEKRGFTWITKQTDLHDRLEGLQKKFDFSIGYESEISLNIPQWISDLGKIVKKGVILLADYGYGRNEFYHPDRTQGTLMCFSNHSKHSNPLIRVGLQDITAHVDFTSVIETAVNSGFSLGGYTTQASFLLGCGLLQLANDSELSEIEKYQINQAIKMLILPSQMGEIIKFMALFKNITTPLIGFENSNRSRDL